MNRMQDRSGRFDLILCSPMKRAKEIAKIIAQQIDYHGDIVSDKNLVEDDSGLISVGKTLDSLKKDPFYDDFFIEYNRYHDLDTIERNLEPDRIFRKL